MAPKIAVVYYSLYGHIAKMAHTVVEGIESAGGKADLYQFAETLPQEILTKMKAPPKDDKVPIITPKILAGYDGFLLGIPTRFGTTPAQVRTFIDSLGGLWVSGGLYGKYVGFFFSTGTLGGGQETTALTTLTAFVHHGAIYVPLGYARTFPLLSNLEEAHGGSSYGAGCLAGSDNSRKPSSLELELALTQGKVFYETLARVNFN